MKLIGLTLSVAAGMACYQGWINVALYC